MQTSRQTVSLPALTAAAPASGLAVHVAGFAVLLLRGLAVVLLLTPLVLATTWLLG